ncbi:MAG: alpha/beta hydrolase, partial [Calditrichaceae bacterium]
VIPKILFFYSLCIISVALAQEKTEVDPIGNLNPVQSSDFHESMVPEPIFGGEIYLLQAGLAKDTTIILIHGVGDLASTIWDGIVPDLAEFFHVIAVDLPGFGSSSKKNILYSPERYAAFIDWLIKNYAQDNVILMGHSLGGGLALCYAGVYPGRLEQLVLVDACGVLHRATLTKYMAQFRTKSESGILQKSINIVNDIWHSLLDGFERPSLEKNLDKILNSKTLRSKILKGDPGKIAGLALVQYDFSEILENIEIPALILWGANDEITPIRTANILNRKLRNSRLFILENAAHSPQKDLPDTFNKIVIRELLHPSLADTVTINAGNDHAQAELKNASFFGINDSTITGQFDSLTIARCQRLELSGIYANWIQIKSSRLILKNAEITGNMEAMNIQSAEVNLKDCNIRSNNVGIRTRGSDLKMTLTTIKADTAIATTSSRFDLAAVELIGIEAAVCADLTTLDSPRNVSDLLFSVSKINSPLTKGNMHKFCNVSPKVAL